MVAAQQVERRRVRDLERIEVEDALTNAKEDEGIKVRLDRFLPHCTGGECGVMCTSQEKYPRST